MKKIPETKNTVIFICNFDPFENTPFSGKTRMRYTLKSDDDEMKFHTLSGMPYPFDGLTIIIYNGAQDWKKNPPKSEEEAKIKVYLEDMKNTDPGKMTSDIARTACRNYKEDPKVVDEVKDWIIYKYGEQMKEEVAEKVAAEVAEKEKALRKEYEEKLEEKQKEYEKKLQEEINDQKENTAKKLIALKMDDETIITTSNISPERLKELRKVFEK